METCQDPDNSLAIADQVDQLMAVITSVRHPGPNRTEAAMRDCVRAYLLGGAPALLLLPRRTVLLAYNCYRYENDAEHPVCAAITEVFDRITFTPPN